MKAKFEFLLGWIIVILTIWKEWDSFSWIGWIIGIIAVAFFWGIWIEENSSSEKTTCKNCGHSVVKIGLVWYHIDCVNQATKKCWETSDCGCPYPEPKRK